MAVRTLAQRLKNSGRRYILWVLAGALLCFGIAHSHNIEDRVLVHAMGIDRAADGYEVSLQVFRSSGAGGDIPIDISRSNVQLIKVRADTVSQALDRCSAKLGRDVFLGHLQTICFGRDVSFERPQELFSFAVRDRSVYLGVELCLAQEKASDIIMTEMKRGSLSSENLRKALDENVKNGRTVECTLLDFLADIKSPMFEAIPVAALSQEGSGENKEPVIDITGTALISGGRVSEYLSPEQSFGLSLLRDEGRSFAAVVGSDGRSYDVRFENADVSRRLCIENGRLVFNVDIDLSAAVSLDIRHSDVLKQEHLSDHLETQLRSAWRQSVQSGCDAVGVWRFVRRKYPKVYLEYEDDIERLISSTKLCLDIECSIE